MFAKDLTAKGMLKGIDQSRNIVLFLNELTLSRHFVVLEICKALESKKHIIIIYETDREHGAPLSMDGTINISAVLQNQCRGNLQLMNLCDALQRGTIVAIPFGRHTRRASMLSTLLSQSHDTAPAAVVLIPTQNVLEVDFVITYNPANSGE